MVLENILKIIIDHLNLISHSSLHLITISSFTLHFHEQLYFTPSRQFDVFLHFCNVALFNLIILGSFFIYAHRHIHSVSLRLTFKKVLLSNCFARKQ